MTGTCYFEDLQEGMLFKSSSREVVEADFLRFADISGDHNPIHVDATLAAESEFGQRVAHGPFGIAVAIGLCGNMPEFRDSAVMMTNVKDWRFIAPILIGDRLTLELTVGRLSRSRSGRAFVERQMRLVRADGTCVQEGTSDMVIKTREEMS